MYVRLSWARTCSVMHATLHNTKSEHTSVQVDIDTVRIDDEPLESTHGILAVLHKPVGYTCSRDPSEGPLVYDLLPQMWLKRRPAITTVGRCAQIV